MAMEFGEYPLHVSVDVEGVHTIAQEDVASAESCAIPASFDAERLSIMQARGKAYGYILVFPSTETEELAANKAAG